ncbi:MAG: peptide ligase PGM1-related protein [Rhodothermales bacterium]|nr:peptide ligase PGM1-related protein [Rhodothermales bacterium]
MTSLLDAPPTLGAAPATEAGRFDALQQRLAPQFEAVFPHEQLPRTVVVVPSLSLDPAELAKVAGVHHYEERLLCMLMLLRMPRTHLVYVTSEPVHPTIIDYYLHLLPGIPVSHARRRLTLLSCHDASAVPLTRKILDRPRLLRRLRAEIEDPHAAHLTCFNASPLERQLAVRLGIPLYATDPALAHLGSKSGSRKLFREAGVAMPDGAEDLRDEDDLVEALAALHGRHPAMRRAVVKLNEGFSGEGNALFSFEGAPEGGGVAAWIRAALPRRLRFEAEAETWAAFRAKFAAMGGIAECFIEGAHKRSPSAQCRINPLGQITPISTHDQVLGGPSGQIFLGCRFPADAAYRMAIQEAGLRVADVLRRHGALGRFGVDFISVREGDAWRHYAIEVNLRKGGTTHPFLMLQYLTDGAYDPATGRYRTPAGQPRAYYASDNLCRPDYRGLSPDDLIDIAVCHGLHFHGATQQGVVFHLIGALSEFGKLGVVCIGDTIARARALYRHTVEVLDAETEDGTATC